MKSITILSLVTFLAASPVQLDRRLIDIGAKVKVADLINADVDLGILDKGKLLRLNTDIGVLSGKKDPANPYPYPNPGFPYPYPQPYPYPYPYPGVYPPQQPNYPYPPQPQPQPQPQPRPQPQPQPNPYPDQNQEY